MESCKSLVVVHVRMVGRINHTIHSEDQLRIHQRISFQQLHNTQQMQCINQEYKYPVIGSWYSGVIRK